MGGMKNVKTRIRLMISRIIGKKMEGNKSLDRLLKSVQIVSFDVFDTLIFRDARLPSDIFDIVGKKVLSANEATGFKAVRIQAEKDSKAGKEETTLDEIYDKLTATYGKEKSDRLKETEISTELESCHVNPEALRFFNRLKESGKRIVIVSDMYLSADTIGKILSDAGYNGYEKLFVSSEYGKTKRSGSLYGYAANELGVRTDQILHIGDNLRSDYLSAKKQGLKAMLYKR